MKTVLTNVECEIVLKNSRFISMIFPLSNSDISPLLQSVKVKYPDATHYCYAYIFQDIKHFSDDGEPGGTAGMPLMNVLEKKELTNVLLVCVRYFGGIKLGAGGLVRAYTKSATNLLNSLSLVELIDGYKISITCSYNQQKTIDYLLRDDVILSKDFQENVSYVALIPCSRMDSLTSFHPTILNQQFVVKNKST